MIARTFRYDGRTWKSLGGPELPDAWEETGARYVNRIVVNRGEVLTEVWWWPPTNLLVVHEVYRATSGQWPKLIRTGEDGRPSDLRLAGWLS